MSRNAIATKELHHDKFFSIIFFYLTNKTNTDLTTAFLFSKNHYRFFAALQIFGSITDFCSIAYFLQNSSIASR